MEWNTIVILIIGAVLGKVLDEFSISLKDKRENKKEKIKKDQKLYEEFINDIPSDSDLIYFFKEHDFGTTFEKNLLLKLFEIENKWNKIEYEYFNSDIEKIKKEFIYKLNDLNRAISSNTFQLNNQVTTRKDKENKNIDFDKDIQPVINLLNNKATQVYNQYIEFIKETKNVLY